MSEGAAYTPAIEIDEAAGRFCISGESYPENVEEFYAEFRESVARVLAGEPRSIEVKVDLIYFNSSSAEVIGKLFDDVDKAAERGFDVAVIWVVDDPDDEMLERGEELTDNLKTAKYIIEYRDE